MEKYGFKKIFIEIFALKTDKIRIPRNLINKTFVMRKQTKRDLSSAGPPV